MGRAARYLGELRLRMRWDSGTGLWRKGGRGGEGIARESGRSGRRVEPYRLRRRRAPGGGGTIGRPRLPVLPSVDHDDHAALARPGASCSPTASSSACTARSLTSISASRAAAPGSTPSTRCSPTHECRQGFGITRNLAFSKNLALSVHHTDVALFQRTVDPGVIVHGRPLMMLGAR